MKTPMHIDTWLRMKRDARDTEPGLDFWAREVQIAVARRMRELREERTSQSRRGIPDDLKKSRD